MNLIEANNNNNQMELEFAGQMVERHDVQAPGLLEVSGGHHNPWVCLRWLLYFLRNRRNTQS